MAAFVYTIGALCMIVFLCFRLTVVPWAAERIDADGAVPAGFTALEGWAGSCTSSTCWRPTWCSRCSASVVVSDGLAPWSGWVGLGLGIAFLTGFVATRFAGPFNPPFMAHLYTGLLGVVLLVT